MSSDDDLVLDAQDDNDNNKTPKPPSVAGEENVFSGDMAGAEPADIDAELEKVGLRGDEEGVKPLGIDEKP